MTTRRIITDIEATDPADADQFYGEIFGLELLMDFGWIRTYGSKTQTSVQISIASEGGSGTPVPDISIEVDNIDDVLQKVKAADIQIEYGPVSEPWGVKRFFIRDPFGKLVNVLQHE